MVSARSTALMAVAKGKRRADQAGATGPVAGVAAAPVAASGPSRAGSRELVRRLELSGLRSVEAGNVVAYLRGLRPVAGGWRVEEIDHLLFLRALVADGRLGS